MQKNSSGRQTSQPVFGIVVPGVEVASDTRDCDIGHDKDEL